MIHKSLPNDNVAVFEIANTFNLALGAESNESAPSLSLLLISTSDSLNPGVLSHTLLFVQSGDNISLSPSEKVET